MRGHRQYRSLFGFAMPSKTDSSGISRFTLRPLMAGAMLSLGALMVAAPAQAEPFEEVMQRLLAEHPALAAATAETAAAGAEIKGAQAGYLPVVTLSGEAVQEAIDDPEDGQSNLLARRGEAAARLNVFDGMATTNSVRSAEAGRNAALSAEQATAQQLLLDAAIAYISVMQARDILELVTEETSLTGAQIEAARELEEQGGGTAIDRLTSYQRHEAARNRLSRARSEMRAAMIRYRSVLMGEPDMTVMRLYDPVETALPGSLEQLTEIAVAKHPELSISAAQVDQARAQRKAANSGYLPSVDVIASTSYEEDISGTEGDRQDFRVGVEARWEIFSGFATQAAKQAAMARLEASRHRERDTRRIVTERARLAWNELILAQEQVSISQELSQAANDFYKSQTTLEDKGRGTRLASLAAEAQAVQTHIDLVRARYTRITAKYGVLAAAGMLTPEMLTIDQARIIETVTGLDADAANAVNNLELSGLADDLSGSGLDTVSRGFRGLPPYPARKPPEVIEMEPDSEGEAEEAARLIKGPEYAGLSVMEIATLCDNDDAWDELREQVLASRPDYADHSPEQLSETTRTTGQDTATRLTGPSSTHSLSATTGSKLVGEADTAPRPAPTVEQRAANAIATARRLITEREAVRLQEFNRQTQADDLAAEAKRLQIVGQVLESRIRLLMAQKPVSNDQASKTPVSSGPATRGATGQE
ncbi:MAG: hypothetical protein Alpg2KO_11540 [Alphaproteobacteria bacterium]